MIDHTSIQFALRAKLMALSVATTGAIAMSATATGYARGASTGTVSAVAGAATFSTSQAGLLANGSTIVVGGVPYTLSGFNGTTGGTLTPAATFGASAFVMGFLTDGFDLGMEITPAGFASNPVDIITGVSALTITTKNARSVEGSAGGRTLTVGLPSSRSWENIGYEPTAGIPWVEEQYLPGPAAQVTLGPNGELELTPQYAPRVHVPADTGMTVSRYADAMLRLFAPRTAIALPNGDVLRVRSDVAPYPGQTLQSRPGFAMRPITIPLRLRTQNSI